MAHKEKIAFRFTTIRTFQVLHIILPIKDIFQKPITNYSLSGERRIDVTLTLPVKTDAHRITETIRKALEQIPEIREKKTAGIRFTDYTGDTLKLEVWCWIDNTAPPGFVDIRDKIISRIYDARREENKPSGSG